jgi:protein gp37
VSEKTGIQWTDHTWNPWHGCAHVSPGCDNCYMFAEKKQYGQDPEVVVRSKTKFRDPLKWKAPARVFTCSWSDFFIAEADAWRTEAWEIIRSTPHLTYQILTKRPARIAAHLPEGWPFSNVHLGVSIESRKYLYRAAVLQAVPAAVRFLSLEPLLEDLALLPDDLIGIGWVIVGGESGSRARTFNIEWGRSIVRTCKAASVPVFMKQTGSRPIGLKVTGKGGDMAEWPSDLRVREFPA